MDTRPRWVSTGWRTVFSGRLRSVVGIPVGFALAAPMVAAGALAFAGPWATPSPTSVGVAVALAENRADLALTSDDPTGRRHDHRVVTRSASSSALGVQVPRWASMPSSRRWVPSLLG